MTWTPIIGAGMNVPEVAALVAQMKFAAWRPSFMVLHNTGAPTLGQWHSVPGSTRMKNLENYFRNERGWSAAPHAFVADDLIWPFTPFNARGVHSPSWNGVALGIEMVGDYDNDDPTQGAGLSVVNNTVALFGILHARLGIDPDTIKLHKEDPLTTHACPGRRIYKAEFIAAVKAYMGTAGEHGFTVTPATPTTPETKTPPVIPHVRVGYVDKLSPGDFLNVRNVASASGKVVAKLNSGALVNIVSEGRNGETLWLQVCDIHPNSTPLGWVAARYIKEG